MSEPTDSICGEFHAWWAILPLPKEDVLKMLPENFELAPPDMEGLPEGQHPVVWEMGVQKDSGPIWPSFLRSNFDELKLEIPWVKVPGVPDPSQAFNYKTIVYSSKYINAITSRYFYKLNSQAATLKVTENTFDGSCSADCKMSAEFVNEGEFKSAQDFANFKVYEAIMNQAWLGGYSGNCTVFAKFTYDFATAKVRPAKMTLTSSQGMFPEGCPLEVETAGIGETPFGTVQVVCSYTLTKPYSLPTTDQKKEGPPPTTDQTE